MAREKKEINIRQDLYEQAVAIAEDFGDFTVGYRCLFLIHRSKEGAEVSNNDKLRKIISYNHLEFVDSLYSLLEDKSRSPHALRIYSSANERDFDKAVRNFKFAQLEADYYDEKSKHQFYCDVKNRFISALCSPRSSKTNNFIIDCDSVSEHEECLKKIAEMPGGNDLIIKQYPTKNGWHIITKPFNPTLLGDLAPKINRDGLLLLAF